MVQIYSGTQNEPDSGIEEPSEKTSEPRNSETSIEQFSDELELRGKFENPEKQLELKERYGFAIKEANKIIETFQNEENALDKRSETSETTEGDDFSLGSSSLEGDTSVVKANPSGLTGKPPTNNTFNIKDSENIHCGDVVNVNNNVVVKVVQPESIQESIQGSIENGRKKLSTTIKGVAAGVLSILILVIIIVIVEITQLQNSSSGAKPSCDDLPPVFTSRYIDRKNWFARVPKKKLHKFTTLPLSKVIIDTTGSFLCEDHFYCPNTVLEMQNRDIASGSVDDIKSNFVLAEDGYIYEGRGWDFVGQNVPGHDEDAIEITIMGNFDAKFPTCSNVSLPLLLDQGVIRGTLAPNYKIYGKHQFYESGCSTMKQTSPLVQDMEKWMKWSPTTFWLAWD